MGKIAKDKSEVVAALPRACADEAEAVEFLERMRWGGEPGCVHCGSTGVYQMRDRKTGERNHRFLWRCRDCGRQYTVRIGTVFEDSRIPLRHWCYGFWAACASKKGVSALQIKRQTGLSYKSALFMMHRIRYAMADDHSKPAKMTGTVEVDETYVGGKPRYNLGYNKRGRGTKKVPVVALVQRGGDVRAKPMRVTALNVKKAILDNVGRSARIVTDEWPGYRHLDRDFRGGHETVKHRGREYVRGDVTTNTVEGFFALLKRGIYGTFHSVSKKHLHRYVSEFEFRYNTRHMDDGERIARVIRKAEGKRLLYRNQLQA